MSEHLEMRNLLGPYVMGSLEPGEEREVEDHLRACAGCSEEANGLRIAHESLLDLVRATESPPQDLEERVLTAIPRRNDRRRLPPWMVAVAAAFCVLVVLGTILVPDLSGGRALASATLTPRTSPPTRAARSA
jgi:anti-sigma factor RsiW